MTIGLTRTKNLSESGLNLKTALQKLYAPGIENDLELFSLSSSLESLVFSGQETSPDSQIVGVATEQLKTASGEVIKRTKFITKFFTFTDENEIYFSKYELGVGGDEEATAARFSNLGSVPSVNLINGGGGYYVTDIYGVPYIPSPSSPIVLKNTPLRGKLSGSTTARAKITLTSQSTEDLNLNEITRFTPGYTTRYTISDIEITEGGDGYLIPELLEPIEGQVSEFLTGIGLILVKQRGFLFDGQPPIIRTKQFLYKVKNADGSGFFLYDDESSKYLFIDKDSALSGFSLEEANSLELRRFDGINLTNISQFRFSQSAIYLRQYDYAFSIIGGSISGEINRIASVANSLQLSTQDLIQNTRRPTSAQSEENIFGYTYNSFSGKDLVIWQRVVLRDQDYLLEPSIEVTGEELKTNVTNFQLNSNQQRVPGLFIRVGNEYVRAFSLDVKPFFREELNPKLSAGTDRYALSAEDTEDNGVTWYAYNTSISEFAQRIHPNGRNGAFYYHRPNAPLVRTLRTGVKAVYAVPLFNSLA
jgi:hypothetical protein